MTWPVTTAFSLSLLGSTAFANPNQVQPGAVESRQALLAEQIRSGTADLASRAVSEVARMSNEKIGPELRSALFLALQREAAAHVQHYEISKDAKTAVSLDNAEYVLQLSRAVGKLEDPSAIPALTAAIFTGARVPSHLAAFGEKAAAPVLEVTQDPLRWYGDVEGALLTLRFMVDARATHPLSQPTLERMRDVARQRLTGTQYFTVLWRAIDLAIALGDAELRRIVSLLASKPYALRSRGITDPDLIQDTQQRARERLAGLPALPRR